MTDVQGRVKRLFKKKEPAFGIWSILNSQVGCEIMAGAGLDFVILDNEHGSFSLSEIESCTRAVQSHNADVFVRVSRPDSVEIQKVLDIGIQGILVPQVRSAQEVREVVASCCLAPTGKRGFNPFTRAGQFRGNSKSAFFDPTFLTVGVLIENQDALGDLDAILEVPGLDLIYIGVYDLSCALGVAGEVTHPRILELLEFVSQKAIAAKVEVGLMVSSRSSAVSFREKGYRFFVFKPDTSVFFDSIQLLLR